MARFVLKLLPALACSASLGVGTLSADDSAQFDAVFERLSAVQTLRGRYSQSRDIAALSRPLVSTGTFIVSELGLYWEQQEPFKTITIADEQRLHQTVADGPPLNVTAGEQPIVLAITQIFLGIFQGRASLLDRYFAIEFTSEATGWRMMLEPRGLPLSEAVTSIAVEGQELVERLTVRGRAGDRLTLDLHDLHTSPALLTAEERALYIP